MNIKQREETANKIFDECLSLMKTKGAEYSGVNKDVLSNFKRTAEAIGVTPIQVLIIFMHKHWDSILTAVRRDPYYPKDGTEPFVSRITDLINYALMLQCLREDAEKEPYKIIDIGVTYEQLGKQ